MKPSGHMLLLAIALVALPATGTADIYQWTDNAGVVHFTNLKAEVPPEVQASVHVVVDEAARSQAAASDGPAPDPPAPAAPTQPSQAELDALYNRGLWLNAYLAGLQSALASRSTIASGGSVEINGPLVVGGSSPAPISYAYGAWPYTYACPWGYPYGCGY